MTLWRQNRGELPVSIRWCFEPWDVQHSVEQFDIPFTMFTLRLISRLPKQKFSNSSVQADFVVLALHADLVEDFLKHIDVPIINIHHSFLPRSSVRRLTVRPRNVE